MEVEVTGLPEPTVTWMKDDKPIQEAGVSQHRLLSQGNSYKLIIEKGEWIRGLKENENEFEFHYFEKQVQNIVLYIIFICYVTYILEHILLNYQSYSPLIFRCLHLGNFVNIYQSHIP